MSMSIRAKRGIFFGLALFILIGIFISTGVFYCLTHPLNEHGPDQVFYVRQGATLRDVADRLEKEGIISSKGLLVLWSRAMHSGTRIKAGEYRLSSAMTPLKILDMLTKGHVLTHTVTIPEGFTIRQIAQELDRKGLTKKDKFVGLAMDPDLAHKYGLSSPTLEGYLYPDTYRFSRDQSALSIIDVMVKRFFEKIAPLRPDIETSGMGLEQVVTIASLIEKETGRGEERPVIASVFLNRLKKGMRLQSDPTVIYGIADFNGNLTRRHLKQEGPYNTYRIRGLPPGPIASPGLAAIQAVLFPAQTDYLFFVSKNDGTHQFSRTLAEHNRAINTYQKR